MTYPAKIIASVRYAGRTPMDLRTTLWIDGQCVEGVVALAVKPGAARKYRMEIEVEVDDLVFFFPDGTHQRAVV